VVVSLLLLFGLVYSEEERIIHCSSSNCQRNISLLPRMKVVQVPVLSDNIAYLLIDEATHIAAAVDPAEPDKVLAAAAREGVEIKYILTTHHHWDHAGGNEGMVAQLPNLAVYGGDDRIPKMTNKVGNSDSFQVGNNVRVDVFFTPCHTSGHVLYVASSTNSQQPKALFSGDTLFIGGCGRFFEGSASQMYHALIEVVAELPKDTQVYCGHEYTEQNLRFALTVEPQNQVLKEKYDWATKKRAAGQSTIPSTVEEELAFNPFMRVRERTVLAVTGQTDPIQAMDALRNQKNAFK